MCNGMIENGNLVRGNKPGTLKDKVTILYGRWTRHWNNKEVDIYSKTVLIPKNMYYPLA